MARLWQLMYHDLAFYVIGGGGFFFILALLAIGWWESRRARIMSQQGRGFRPVRRFTPLAAFLKMFARRGLRDKQDSPK